MQRALAIDRSTGAAANIAYTLGNLAEVLNDCGLPQQALQYGLEGVAMARTLQNKELLHVSLRILGNVQTHNGDFVGARRSLMESLPLASSNHDVDALVRNLHAQAELLFEESRFHPANEAVAAACQALEWLVFVQDPYNYLADLQRQSASTCGSGRVAATLPAESSRSRARKRQNTHFG